MSDTDPPALPEVQTEDLPCPLCGYNLRGLTEARCPECGAKYEWWELREKQDQPPIYEYRDSIGSFIATVYRTLSPPLFWRTLKPTMVPQIGRLIDYTLIYAIASVVIGLLIIGLNELLRWSDWGGGAAWALQTTLGGSWSAFLRSRDYFGDYLFDNDALRYATFTIIALPITLFMLLISLGLGTLQKAKLKTVHIVRVGLYSGTPLLLGGLLSMFAVYANEGADFHLWYMLTTGELPRNRDSIIALPILLAGILGSTLTLGVACRRYLQVRHAWGVALAAGFVLSLVLFALLVTFR